MSRKFKRATVGFLIVVLLAAVLAMPVWAEDGEEPCEGDACEVEEQVVEEEATNEEEEAIEEPSCEGDDCEVEEQTGELALFSMAGLELLNTTTTIPLNPAHEGATNSEFPNVGECPTPPEGQEGWWGWHFIMTGNGDFTSLSVTFQDAGTFSADPFPGTVFVADPNNKHAYIWTPTDDTLLSGFATTNGNGTSFNLSHVCPVEDYEELTVEKTVDTSFTREHFWDIDKKVETENEYEHDGFPKVWLYIDGSGDETATWTVDVTYEGYDDSAWNVSGDITIENTGTLDAVITDVEDWLAGTAIDVDCGVEFPYTLPVGETLTCTYDEDGYVEGDNEATVTTEVDEYDAEPVAIVWGDPTTEINATVNVKDISDLFGEVDLGTATAPNDAQFTYTKDFAWADYGADGCGDFQYDNEATIVETEQSAEATLLVNVQCYVYETAYAMGDEEICFIPTFGNWGWTNPIGPGTYEWELWAAAGQCDTSKGTLVGTVTVVYGADGVVTVTFNVDPPYSLEETHVYVGYDQFPKDRRGRPTVAPGQYTNGGPFDGSDVYVIAHAVVGLPDPDFGP